MYLKNTSGQHVCFALVSATDGSPITGATPTCRRCIDGTFAAATGTITEDTGLGFYKMALSQADTNGNNISYRFIGTGAVAVVINIVTTSLNPYDAVRGGMTALPNAAADAAGGLPISDAGGLDLDALAANINSTTMVSGTIGATGNDTTHLHLTGLTYADDQLNLHALAFRDASTGLWYGRWITDWVNSTALATLHLALPVTPQNSTDTYRILTIRADSPTALELATVVNAIVTDTVFTDMTNSLSDLTTNLATVDNVADAIKAKTDQLTFGVANTLNANITYVNEIAVTGDGETGTEWGPV